MSKIIRTIAFVIVLGALLTWGVLSLAQGPSLSTISDQAVRLQGQVVENGHEIPRDQIRPFGQ